jgi:hypothetical protein
LINNKNELLSIALPDERGIVDTLLHLKKGGAVNLSSMSESLLIWSKKWISESVY